MLEPLEIHQLISDKILVSTICILAPPHAEAKIIFYKTGTGDIPVYCSEDMRIISQRESNIEFISIQNLPFTHNLMQRRIAKLEKDAHLLWTDVVLGSNYTKSEIITHLCGEGANTLNQVLFLANTKQRFDIYTASIHVAPHTTSNIITKGVVNDQAKVLSRGLVHIKQNATGSNGYEKQDALLLSNDAEADAIPNLEIENHDVKCSHGSTVGQVDADQLFYLMSRGLSKNLAQQKIIEGYFIPILEVFTDDSLKKKIHASIMQAIDAED